MQLSSGSLAVVTGAGSGIGKATARALVQRGVRVVVVDFEELRVAETVAELGAGQALGRCVDVADRQAMQQLAKDVRTQFGAPDVVVNNAGIGYSAGLLGTELRDWERVFAVNLWGVIHGCYFFAPMMVERGRGHIVNVASLFGLAAPPGVAAYSAAKFGVVGLSESLRGELGPLGVGVSVICPGLVATDIMARTQFADESRRARTSKAIAKGHKPELVAEALLRAITKNQGVVPVGTAAWLGYVGKRVAPELFGRATSAASALFAKRAQVEAARSSRGV